jgi:hypothetical protein
MIFAFSNLLLALLFSSLASSRDAQGCRHDSCLRSFQLHRPYAIDYCNSHPNRFLMGTGPLWAEKTCPSLGRKLNKRVRLASACSCLYRSNGIADVTIPTGSVAADMASGVVVSVTSSSETSATDVAASPSPSPERTSLTGARETASTA